MRPRWLYIGIFSWMAVVGGRFLAIFMESHLGWNTDEIGSVLAAAQGVGLLTKACWSGTTADRWELNYPGYGHAMMMVGGIIFGTLALFGHDLIPLEWWEIHVLFRLLYAFGLAMIFPAMDGMCLEYLTTKSITTTTTTTTTKVVVDTEGSDKTNSHQGWARERLWGAVSWGITNIILAIGLDRIGFRIIRTMSLIVTTLVLLIVYGYTKGLRQVPTRLGYAVGNQDCNLPHDDTMTEAGHEDDDPETNQEENAIPSSNTHKDSQATTEATKSTLQILLLLGSTLFGASFMVAQITQSSGQAIVDQLVFLYFADELGSSYTIMGMTVVLTIIFEIPIFQMAPWFLNKWGPGPLIPLAAISYVSRVIGYSLITNPIHVLWLEPLHGVTYACVATAGVEIVVVTLQRASMDASSTSSSYSSSSSKETVTRSSNSSAGQSALQVLIGNGSISGLLAGGWLQETFGPRIMYRVSAFVVATGASLFTIALFRQERETPKYPSVAIEDEDDNDNSSLSPCVHQKNDIIGKGKTDTSLTSLQPRRTLELVSLVDRDDENIAR